MNKNNTSKSLIEKQIADMEQQEADFRLRNNTMLQNMEKQREELLGKIKSRPRVQIVNGQVIVEESNTPITEPVQKIIDILQANPILVDPVTKYLNTLISKIDVAVKDIIELGLT